jgi:hypothetical protein
MKIGAGTFVKNWGTSMTLIRDGVTLVSNFKGRKVFKDLTPDYHELNGSVEQETFLIIGAAEDFGTTVPRKFDRITVGSDTFTVQSMRSAGADEPELYKMFVIGGNP